MKWSEQAWDEIRPIYQQITELSFIKELIDGTLDPAVFEFYIRQDALYLADYGKVLAGIASKLSQPKHIEAFLSFAGDTMEVEKALHASYVKELASGEAGEPSPSCLLYTSFLLRQLASVPVEVAVAAVLPCFWIYKEVGDYILAQPKKEGNPYQAWIDTYGGEEYAAAAWKAIAIADQLASAVTPHQQVVMTDAFVTCSKLEWMFWESAYRQEKWKI